MRLVKLIAYSLLGYVLYEMYLGMTDATPRAARRRIEPGATPDATTGTGPDGGPAKTVAVKDGRGARTKRVVGRGVIH